MRVRRETEPLVVIAHGVILVIGEMVEHQGVVVSVGTDIGSVEVAEVEEFLQCFSEGIFYIRCCRMRQNRSPCFAQTMRM